MQPSMTPMHRVVVFALILLAGCKAHTPPDEALSARLRLAVDATCAAMALPEAERPSGRALADQVGLLAMRLSSQRVQEIDSGILDRSVVVRAYREALARRAERQSRSDPPRLLVFLVEQQASWSSDQTLLAAALLAQYEREAKLAPPPPDLAR